jgi:hypothetical protein
MPAVSYKKCLAPVVNSLSNTVMETPDDNCIRRFYVWEISNIFLLVTAGGQGVQKDAENGILFQNRAPSNRLGTF